jgi:hypothetical protein
MPSTSRDSLQLIRQSPRGGRFGEFGNGFDLQNHCGNDSFHQIVLLMLLGVLGVLRG